MLDLKSDNRFMQFELWKDCKNNCKFCFNKCLPDIDKIDNLDYIISKLNDVFSDNFNEIGFIGGEIFDDQLKDKEVHDKFYQMFSIVISKAQANKIKKIYITSSLLFSDLAYLNEFLIIMQKSNVLDKMLLCTSFDTVGRFHTKEHLQLWKTNMKWLKTNFPILTLHTEIIVTQDFIEQVLSEKFDIIKFQNEYSTTIDYLEPNTGSYYSGKEEFNRNVPKFLPRRADFIKFLHKTCIKDKSIELFKLFSKKIRSDMLYLVYGNAHIEIKGRRNAGRLYGMHLPIMPKFGYIDSDIDMLDDVNALRSIYEQ